MSETNHKEIIGKHVILVGRHENYTPPTNDPKDCICGAKGDPTAGRRLIANCPCCDGVQILSQELCDCKEGHPIKVIVSPNTTFRMRYIDNTEAIG